MFSGCRLLDTDIEVRLAAVFALLPQPCAVLAYRLDLLAIVVGNGVAHRVRCGIRAVLDNVLEKLLVHLSTTHSSKREKEREKERGRERDRTKVNALVLAAYMNATERSNG